MVKLKHHPGIVELPRRHERQQRVMRNQSHGVPEPGGQRSACNQSYVIYTGPNRSFTAPFGLFKWAIAKIDRECFKESFIDNTSSRFAAFSDLSPRLVIISL